MALTKKDMSWRLAEQLDVSEKLAKHLVDSFFEEIKLALEQGQTVKISGFGNFELKDKTPRPGRNPRTGQTVTIDARRVVTFKPGVKLKHTVA